MKSGFLGTMALLFLGAGWAVAQAPAPTTTPPAVVVPPAVNMQPQPALGGSVIGSEAFGGGPILFGGAEYLLWKVQTGRIPPTSTTVPVGIISADITNSSTPDRTIPGTPDANPITGYAPVSIMTVGAFASGPRTDTGFNNGGRVTIGFWDEADQTFGMEAGAFWLSKASDRFASLSGQAPGQFLLDTGFTQTLFLVTPAAGGGPPTQTPLAVTNVFVTRQANASVTGVSSVQLYGAEIMGRGTFFRIGGTDIGGLAGFRFLAFKDQLFLSNSLNLTQPPGLPPTSSDASASISRNLTFRSSDNTRITNNFYGGEIGIDLDSKLGSFFINARGKLGLGVTHQSASINATTSVINNDAGRSPPSSTTAGGLLSGPLDNGRRTRDVFSVNPEVDLKFGYQFTDWLRGYVGYSGIFLNNVARAGDSSSINTQNTTVTVANTPPINVNVAQPTFRFASRDVTVQGITFGFEARY